MLSFDSIIICNNLIEIYLLRERVVLRPIFNSEKVLK